MCNAYESEYRVRPELEEVGSDLEISYSRKPTSNI